MNEHQFKNSSSLSSCDYHDDSGMLEVCFSNGGTYHFKCNKSEYEALKNAASAGSHFQKQIRPKYKGVKI